MWERLRVTLAVAVLIAVGASAHLPRIRETRALASRDAAGDPVGTYDASFAALQPYVPLRGTIGYVTPADWPSVAAVQTFYLAAYALTPRLVLLSTDPEFVIAVPATGLQPDTFQADPRLAGFTLVRQFDDGLLLLRRLK